MLPPFSGAATSQSTVTNDQVQLGDVFATQTLNVVSVSDAITPVTTATGNSLLAEAVSGSLDVQSNQTVTTGPKPGATAPVIDAHTTVNITADVHGQSTITTAATANAAEAMISGGGALTGTLNQVAHAASVTAITDFTATAAQPTDPTVEVENLTALTQAIANSASVSAVGGSANMVVTQSSTARVDAESGSPQPVGGAQVQYTPGTVSFSDIAMSNNLTATGTSGASQTLDVSQTAAGAHTIAGQFLNVGNGQTFQGDAAATANNISASNEAGDLNLTDVQTNLTYTQGDSIVTGYEFGSAQSTASGVGNSVVAANQGPSTELNNVQSNSGQVDATASFTGGNNSTQGYDAVVSSTAVGNGATAFACSDCGGVITVANSQTNANTINATSLVDITGLNRSVASTATAVGNSASFYVSKSK